MIAGPQTRRLQAGRTHPTTPIRRTSRRLGPIGAATRARRTTIARTTNPATPSRPDAAQTTPIRRTSRRLGAIGAATRARRTTIARTTNPATPSRRRSMQTTPIRRTNRRLGPIGAATRARRTMIARTTNPATPSRPDAAETTPNRPASPRASGVSPTLSVSETTKIRAGRRKTLSPRLVRPATPRAEMAVRRTPGRSPVMRRRGAILRMRSRRGLTRRTRPLRIPRIVRARGNLVKSIQFPVMSRTPTDRAKTHPGVTRPLAEIRAGRRAETPERAEIPETRENLEMPVASLPPHQGRRHRLVLRAKVNPCQTRPARIPRSPLRPSRSHMSEHEPRLAKSPRKQKN